MVDAKTIITHLATKHRRHPSARTRAQQAAIYAEALKVEIWNPDTEPFIPPPPSSRPIPGIAVYRGYCCPVESCQYAARTVSTMRNHRTTAHRTPEQGGSVARRGRRRANQEKDPLTVPHPVYCQRLALFGTYSYYFAVTPDLEELLESRTLVPEIDEATFI